MCLLQKARFVVSVDCMQTVCWGYAMVADSTLCQQQGNGRWAKAYASCSVCNYWTLACEKAYAISVHNVWTHEWR